MFRLSARGRARAARRPTRTRRRHTRLAPSHASRAVRHVRQEERGQRQDQVRHRVHQGGRRVRRFRFRHGCYARKKVQPVDLPDRRDWLVGGPRGRVRRVREPISRRGNTRGRRSVLPPPRPRRPPPRAPPTTPRPNPSISPSPSPRPPETSARTSRPGRRTCPSASSRTSPTSGCTKRTTRTTRTTPGPRRPRCISPRNPRRPRWSSPRSATPRRGRGEGLTERGMLRACRGVPTRRPPSSRRARDGEGAGGISLVRRERSAERRKGTREVLAERTRTNASDSKRTTVEIQWGYIVAECVFVARRASRLRIRIESSVHGRAPSLVFFTTRNDFVSFTTLPPVPSVSPPGASPPPPARAPRPW